MVIITLIEIEDSALQDNGQFCFCFSVLDRTRKDLEGGKWSGEREGG